MPTIKDQAICLRLKDWSETSQIAVMLTLNHGKISVMAKGAKRQSPSAQYKYSGGIELLTMGEGVFIVKPTTELANMIEWDLNESYWHLRMSLGAYERAMYAADLLFHLISDHDPHVRSFNAMVTCMRELSVPDEMEHAMLRFQWSVVDDMGYRPELERDVETGERLGENDLTYGFHPVEGGVVVDSGGADRWRVRRETILLLRDVAKGEEIKGYGADAVNRANRLLCTYFRTILNKDLPTMKFLLNDQ